MNQVIHKQKTQRNYSLTSKHWEVNYVSKEIQISTKSHIYSKTHANSNASNSIAQKQSFTAKSEPNFTLPCQFNFLSINLNSTRAENDEQIKEEMLTNTTHRCAGEARRSCWTERGRRGGWTSSARRRVGGPDRVRRRRPEATAAASRRRLRSGQCWTSLCRGCRRTASRRRRWRRKEVENSWLVTGRAWSEELKGN